VTQEPDYWDLIAIQRAAQLDAFEARIRATLAENYAAGGSADDSENVQLLANCRQERANLAALHQQHTASKQPYVPPQPSPEEKASKPWQRCDWSDSWEWASKSKHGIDPEGFKAGMQEVMARRQRGE
jgi:hypothetical protein